MIFIRILLLTFISLLIGCGGGDSKNHPPIAFDQNLSVKAGKSIKVPFKADDPDGDQIKFIVYKLPQNGRFDADNLTYTPNDTFAGIDEIAFYAVDDKNNRSNDAKIIIQSLYDAPPTLTLNGAETIIIELGDNFDDPGATAIDPEDGNISDTISTSGIVDTSTIGTYTITYSVTDSASHSVTKTREVRVVLPRSSNDDLMIINPHNSNLVISYDDNEAPYDPNTLTVNIYDNTPQVPKEPRMVDIGNANYALELFGNGIDNAFHILGYDTIKKYYWNEHPEYQTRFHISWDAKFSSDFVIYIVLKFQTADGQTIWNDLVYTPTPNGYEGVTNGFLHISLGIGAKDGEWHHYERDILDDLHRFYPGATIPYNDNKKGYVNGFAIRGSGLITNLKLSLN